ncbi:MAG: GWxTD domain-containing protein [Rubricoccaceae bacterium]|nr:GWxTD domain-containing protein [Rubricoccaceae bacterium]
MNRLRPVCLLLATLLLPAGAWAQAPDAEGDRPDPVLQEGIQAYRDARYEDARRLFERAVQANPDDAEAHFLLARIYYDTPLRDEDLAGDHIARARALDPENLRYQVAELQQLRSEETWNFFQEMQQQRRRLDLAQAILERDPDNGFAHEEFGVYYIRDYYYYRNAIALPGMQFASRGPTGSDEQNDDLGSLAFNQQEVNASTGQILDDANRTISDANVLAQLRQFYDLNAPGEIDVTDRFNLDVIRSQGARSIDLSRRADGAYRLAVFHLTKALESDPRRRAVYDHLVRLHSLAGEWDEASGLLAQMLVYFPDDVETWLYLGLANHRLGRDDAAAVSFGEALERMGPERRAVFDDIALLLPEDEQARYEADPETVASRFWTSQEPRYLTPYNERRLEHYARLTYADLMYRSEDLGLPGWETQRGKVHVRYGVPEADVVITGSFQQVLENFAARAEGPDRDGFERPALSNPIEATEANRFNIWDYGDFKLVFEDPFRNGEFRLYSPPADLFALTGPASAAVDNMDYERIARETFRETPERYDYEPPGRRIGLPYLVTTFDGDDGQTDVYVHYGIPVADSFDPAESDVVDLTIQTGAFLISDARDVLVERRRTLYGLNASQVASFEDVQLWTDTQAMEAPPGTHTVSVEFETVGGGTSAVQRRDIAVPGYDGTDLALSSIMLAYLVEETDEARIPGHVVRDGLAIQPAPWSVFNHAQPVYLFFEVYNLGLTGGQSDYEVEAELRPKDTSSGIARLARSIFGGGERGVSTRYPVQGDRADDAQYVILDAAEQEPGFYTLTLRIRDRISGRTVEETTDLYLE